MWGNFMDKAKDLAANLDKQLNDSVGIDAAANPSASTTTTTSGSTIPTATGSANVDASFSKANAPPSVSAIKLTASQDAGGNDAWNDDFDFDDDDDAGEVEKEKKNDTIMDTPQEVLTTATTKPAAVPDDHDDDAQQSFVPPIVTESPAEAPTTSPPDDASTGLLQEESPSSSPPPPQPTSGWDGEEDDIVVENNEDDDDDVDVNFQSSEAVDDEPPQEPDSAFPPSPAETEVVPAAAEPSSPISSPVPSPPVSPTASPSVPASGGEMEEIASPKPTEPSPAPPSSPGQPTLLSPSIPSSPLSKDQGEGEDEDASPAPAPAASAPKILGPAFGSSMFSSLAHRAESLAQQAESFVHTPDGEPTQNNSGGGGGGMTSLFSSFGASAGTTTATTTPASDNDDDKLQDSAAGWADDAGEALDLDFDDNDNEKEEEAFPNAEGGKDGSPMNDTEPDPQMDSVSNGPPPRESSPTHPPTNNIHSIPEPSLVSIEKPVSEDDPRYQEVLKQLKLREEQLSNKSMQLTQLQDIMDQQERELKQKLSETKEEAKKRILRAKERCDAAEAKVQQLQSASNADANSQTQLIQALREEGEKLAHKQSAMEQAVRAARSESRELAEQLEVEQDAKNKAFAKITKLESELKFTKESLSAARRGESQAGKLEQDLLAARSDAELKAATVLSLQQQVKELTAEGKELQEQLKRSRKEAEQAAQQEKKSLRREHHDIINDLEAKLRTTEREAGVREDALRHEVSELRKRWQDAVRRADALSMDVQSSTAPLLRQLESMERQNRARAANWAELENRLRSELEETVIQNETLSKERSEFKTKYTRMERSMTEQEQELKQSKRIIEEQTVKVTKLEAQLEQMEAQAEKREDEYTKVERLANEGVMRVRSEMTQTVVESEERYRGQIEKLEVDLRVEREKRSQLEKQVDQMLENAGMMVAPQAQESVRREAKPKKLRQAQGQAEILAGTLGFDSDTEDDDDDESLGHPMDRGNMGGNGGGGGGGGGMNSFAALDQLTSRLKAAKIELEALRRNLRESEQVRESLVVELGESRTAKEKLPLFEAKVKELTEDNREKELEIQGLREDIADVREMYRTQLNVLLEEKAAQVAPTANGGSQPNELTEMEAETPASN